MLTRDVFIYQHHSSTQRVFNGTMSTIGERIRRARQARGLSGEELASKVGYKNQSSIGNLENRSSTGGGKKLPDIARALRVPLTWLIEGPDTDEVPFSEPQAIEASAARGAQRMEESSGRHYAAEDASIQEATALFRQLRTHERLQAIKFMRELIAAGSPEAQKGEVGEGDSVPHYKAA